MGSHNAIIDIGNWIMDIHNYVNPEYFSLAATAPKP